MDNLFRLADKDVISKESCPEAHTCVAVLEISISRNIIIPTLAS
jgi:hypothetical protein